MFVAVRSSQDAYCCQGMTWGNIRERGRGGGPGKTDRVGRPRLEVTRVGRGGGSDHLRHRVRPASYRGYKKGSAEFMPARVGGPSAYRSRMAGYRIGETRTDAE